MPVARHPTRIGEGLRATEASRGAVVAFLNALAAGDDCGNHVNDEVTHTAMETGEVTRGRDAVVRWIDHLYREAFAASVEVRSLVVENERAFLEADFVGTHVGEFAGIPPSGRMVRAPLAVAYDLANGRIAALRVYLPLDALIRQIRAA